TRVRTTRCPFGVLCVHEPYANQDSLGVRISCEVPMKHGERPSRRRLLQMAAAAGGGLVAAQQRALALDTPGTLGTPLGPYTERSPFEKATRLTRESRTPQTGSSFTPLQDSVGSVTPSALHYERHHAGIPNIDPSRHRVVIHGMVDRPLSLSMADIRR